MGVIYTTYFWQFLLTLIFDNDDFLTTWLLLTMITCWQFDNDDFLTTWLLFVHDYFFSQIIIFQPQEKKPTNNKTNNKSCKSQGRWAWVWTISMRTVSSIGLFAWGMPKVPKGSSPNSPPKVHCFPKSTVLFFWIFVWRSVTDHDHRSQFLFGDDFFFLTISLFL